MVVQHNMQAANANRMLGLTTRTMGKTTEKLASGYKVNRAADDAAGLAISEKMRYAIRGLERASLNAQDGISVVQIAEGAMNESHAILQRMNELATQAASDTNTTTDRTKIKEEVDQLTAELDRIYSTTQFNTMNLLDGKFTSKKIQVGMLSGQTMSISISSCKASDLLGGSIDVTSQGSASAAMTSVQAAIDKLSSNRSKLGAIQNRLEHTINNLDNAAENTQAAESRIRDTDMAKAMVEYSKNNILSQAGQSMLAQANQSTQGVLSLLQ